MFRPRQIVLATLIIVPLLLYIVLGAYALWETGWLALIGWLLPLSWALTWVIAKLWPSSRSRRSADPRPIEIPEYWTPRDAEALKIVREHQQRVGEVTVQNLTNPHYYLDAATVLATDLGRHYHPDQSEPLNGLTIPEVAAATRLAIDDMEEWLLETVPGNQIVTIGQWRLLAGAPRWINHARNAGWAASVLINPLNLVRYATSQLALTPITQELQGEMLATLFQRFLRQIGFYLIEMNSGRLRGGAAEYRRTFGNLVSLQSKLTAEGGGAEQLQVADITIAYDASELNGLSSDAIGLFRSDMLDGPWNPLASTNDPVDHLVQASVAAPWGVYTAFDVNAPTASPSLVATNGLHVWPTLTSEQIFIHSTDGTPLGPVVVFDGLGRSLAIPSRTSSHDLVELDVAHLAAGAYYVRVGDRAVVKFRKA